MKILYNKDNETLIYAADELAHYLNKMDSSLSAEKEKTDNINCSAPDAICLGLLSDFGLSDKEVTNPLIDDLIDIHIQNGSGYIAGSNIRSILLGVYTYLKSGGCMWLRPGIDGEYIPEKEMKNHSYTYRKMADYPFRGECIEGAVSYEHVRDTVIWLPRVGMNLFMMEQIIPYNYMSRWYEHVVNTVKEDEHVSFEQIGEYVIKLEKLIKKCGLQLHALGHGYLLEPYGIHYKKFGLDYKLSDEAREDVALVDGKRELFLGSPNFTQLCFSKDKARLGLVNFLVEYMEKKPYIDFLHVWLSDAANNQCECENCRKMIPTDYYVMMLNELDAELTKRNIETKIVFIMYVDTFWAPEKIKFNNPDRFIMTTALCRSFNKPLSAKRYEGELPEFVRNDFKMASSCDVSLSFMDTWKPTFDGKRFAFDYYMYTDHFFDPGYFQNTKLILDDIQVLDTLGFHGIMSDQTQRSFFPNGLPLAVMGEGLTDRHLNLAEYTDNYFKAAYGEKWKECRDYLRGITELFNPCDIRSNEGVVIQDTGTGDAVEEKMKDFRGNPESAERLGKIKGYIDSFLPTIAENRKLPDKCHAKSWDLLWYHAEYCKMLSELFVEVCNKNKDEARKVLAKMIDWLSEIEDEIAPQFDLVLFNQRMNQTIDA